MRHLLKLLLGFVHCFGMYQKPSFCSTVPSFLNNYRRRLCLFSTFKILEYLFICLGMNTVNQLCFFLIIQCWAEVPLLTPWSPKLQLTPKREILFYPKAGAVARPRLHEHTNHPF